MNIQTIKIEKGFEILTDEPITIEKPKPVITSPILK